MGCLYCGKDIGPFRLLRDNEFCSSVHRKRYGERLGKALDRIGAPELVPSGIPGACKVWPFQEGRNERKEGVWDFGHPEHPVQIGELWQFTVTPTLGALSKPLTAPEPAACVNTAAWSNSSVEPLSIPVSLPHFGRSLHAGLPVITAAVAGKTQMGMAPRESLPKARVIPLPARGSKLKPRPATVICLPAFEAELHSGLPLLDAAVNRSREEGIPPREGRPKATVFPLPVNASASREPDYVERPYRPVLRRIECWIPVPEPEAAERPVLPSAAPALDAAIVLAPPQTQILVIRASQAPPIAPWEPSLAAEPAAMWVAPSSHLEPLGAMRTPCFDNFAPIPAAEGESAGSQEEFCPHIPSQPPIPVESWVIPSVALSPIAASLTQMLRLPNLDKLADSPVSTGLSCAGRSGSSAWPSPVPSLIPPTAAAQSPTAVDAGTLELQLPAVGDLPVPAARWTSCPTWPSPAEAFIPPVRGPEPLSPPTGLWLPALGPHPLSTAIVVPSPSTAGIVPKWPVAADASANAASTETISVEASAVPRVPGPLERTSALSLAPEVAGTRAAWVGPAEPPNLTPSRDSIALPPNVPAMRLPKLEVEADLCAFMVMSEHCPSWPGVIKSPVQPVSQPEPIGLTWDVPALRLPSLPSAELPASMGMSEACPDEPSLAQPAIPLAAAPSPFAAAANNLSPRLPNVGRAFEIPSLLTRLRTPAAYRDQPSLSVLPGASRSSSFSPAPVPTEPPAIVLSLPLRPRAGTGSGVGPSSGPTPSPVESLPTIAAFAPFRILARPQLQFPQVPEPMSTGLSAAGSGESYPTCAPPDPTDLTPNTGALQPISLLRVNRLALPADHRDPEIPRPGFIPIEFYCQRGWVAPCQRLSWSARTFDPLLQPFAMRVVADKTDDVALWRPAPKAPASRDIPAVSDAAKRRARERLLGRLLKVAACLVMGAFLWFGAREVKSSEARALANRAASGTVVNVPSPAVGLRAGAAPAAPEPKGALTGVRQAIADRAAYSVTDTLQTGMSSWGTPAKSWAPGWSRNPDGYVHPGDLALFHPSLAYKDYRLEFFGQIENKSIGWVVRAQDKQNYYAMKFTVLENGLRPVIAMAHYPVVGGRKGKKVETPLSVMMHHNTPIHVAIDIQGNRVTASVEGQQVDSWTDELLPKGGVGFFSDAGERARLYWMKVSKNQDWLGVVCSYLSGDSGGSSRDTAEVWGPGIPGEMPGPITPTQPQDLALAEGESGANDFSGPHRARITIQRRIRPWSS